jgi:hypothetical protein
MIKANSKFIIILTNPTLLKFKCAVNNMICHNNDKHDRTFELGLCNCSFIIILTNPTLLCNPKFVPSELAMKLGGWMAARVWPLSKLCSAIQLHDLPRLSHKEL